MPFPNVIVILINDPQYDAFGGMEHTWFNNAIVTKSQRALS